MKFYKVSNTIVEAINGKPELEELKIRSIDASVEKHVPQVVIDDNKVIVTVGSVEHPMVDNHYIEFIKLKLEMVLKEKTLDQEMSQRLYLS